MLAIAFAEVRHALTWMIVQDLVLKVYPGFAQLGSAHQMLASSCVDICAALQGRAIDLKQQL